MVKVSYLSLDLIDHYRLFKSVLTLYDFLNLTMDICLVE